MNPRSPTPPAVGRALARLIVGPKSEELRGDLEESFHRRVEHDGDSARARLGYIGDVLRSVIWWWWHRAIRFPNRPAARAGRAIRRTAGPELRQLWRGLARRPGHAGMVILTLGLGIGATATIYSVVDALLVRPLPYRDADALVVIGTTIPGREWLGDRDGLERLERIALPNFRDVHRRTPGLGPSVPIERRQWLGSSAESGAEILDVANVSDGFFELLAVKPLLGRLLRPGDQSVDGGVFNAVITYDGWRRRFGGDPHVVGKTLSLGITLRIVGVLPKDFQQPAALVGSDVELWLYLDPTDSRYADRRRRQVEVLARVQPGTSLEGLRRQLEVAQREVAREQVASNVMPNGDVLGVGANSLRDATIGSAGRPLLLFLGAAGLLLVLAGTNAANLLLVRGLEREAELSLRRALGASRGRLALNLVSESVSLALAGGLVGLGIAALGVGGFHRFGAHSLPRATEVGVSGRVVLVGVVLSLAVGVVIGLVPAIRSSGTDLLTNLRSSLRAMSLQGTRLRNALAATQLALALVLGIGAGLLFRSFAELRSEQLGFTPRGLVASAVVFKTARPWETWDQVLAAIRAVPGVRAAAGASSLPFQTPAWEPRVQPAEQSEEMSAAPIPGFAVTPSFFSVAGIPIVQGRSFDGSDQPESHPVAIVNRTLATTVLAGRPALGARLRIADAIGPGREVEIVGVAGDVVQTRVEDGIKPALYVPYTQLPATMNVIVATNRDLDGLGVDMRRGLANTGLATAPMIGLESMEARIEATRAGRRFQALLIGAFAGVALLLSAIGLYGTLAFTVRSRTKELGIRMAIGAGQRQVFGLVLKQGFAVLGVGLVIGLIGALGLTRLLQGFLYRVSPIDPVAFLLTTGIVAASVLLAALRPARRASKIDPMSSIRVEG